MRSIMTFGFLAVATLPSFAQEGPCAKKCDGKWEITNYVLAGTRVPRATTTVTGTGVSGRNVTFGTFTVEISGENGAWTADASAESTKAARQLTFDKVDSTLKTANGQKEYRVTGWVKGTEACAHDGRPSDAIVNISATGNSSVSVSADSRSLYGPARKGVVTVKAKATTSFTTAVPQDAGSQLSSSASTDTTYTEAGAVGIEIGEITITPGTGGIPVPTIKIKLNNTTADIFSKDSGVQSASVTGKTARKDITGEALMGKGIVEVQAVCDVGAKSASAHAETSFAPFSFTVTDAGSFAGCCNNGTNNTHTGHGTKSVGPVPYP